MKKLKFKKDFKYKFTIVILSLLMFIGVLSSHFTDKNFYIISSLIGCFSLIAIVISVIGLFKSLKKLKSKTRFFSIIMISLTACLLLYIITANIIEAIKFIF